ncbi:MAG TPA: RES family NAD+ phosphorylase [Alloacidobacterium sp.]|nr:RES family NAD+ phosphorylase [Alloacidobacterium sp.]
MILWRISRFRDLKGTGGLRASGRWHHAGQPVVYLAESPSAALLEVCVHTAANDVPPAFTLLKIEGPELPITEVSLPDLPDNWQLRLEITRELGDAWLHRAETALLHVPSAIVPATTNYLLNPLHADAAKLQIIDQIAYPFDARLKS